MTHQMTHHSCASFHTLAQTILGAPDDRLNITITQPPTHVILIIIVSPKKKAWPTQLDQKSRTAAENCAAATTTVPLTSWNCGQSLHNPRWRVIFL